MVAFFSAGCLLVCLHLKFLWPFHVFLPLLPKEDSDIFDCDTYWTSFYCFLLESALTV